MVHKPLSPQSKSTKGWLYLLTALSTVAVIILSIALAGSVYTTLQSRSFLEHQRYQQASYEVFWYQLDRADNAFIRGDYLSCLAVLTEVPDTSPYYYRSQKLLDKCYEPLGKMWLLDAEALAKSGELKNAIDVALQIKAGPSYALAKQRIEQWSQRIIELANDRYYTISAKSPDAAVSMLRVIPENTPLYKTSQGLIAQWEAEWADNSHYVASAYLSLESNSLSQSTEAAKKISQHVAWSDERSQLLLEIQAKEQSLLELAQERQQNLEEDGRKQNHIALTCVIIAAVFLLCFLQSGSKGK